MSTYTGMSLNTVTSAYWIYKGTSSVEAINKATPKIGYTYTLTDAGKITNGNIDVVKGDVICYLNGGWILVTEGNLGAVVTALNKQVHDIDTELSGTRQDLINRINNTDKALANYKDEMVIDQARQDGEIAKRLTISTYDTDRIAQAQTDKAQSDAIAELQKHKQVNADWNATSGVAQILNKPTLAKVATSGSYNDLTDKPTPPSPTSQCVPYSADLDAITDDLGVAWMNTSKTDTSKEYGHLYRKGEQIVIPKGEKYYNISENPYGLPVGVYRMEASENIYVGGAQPDRWSIYYWVNPPQIGAIGCRHDGVKYEITAYANNKVTMRGIEQGDVVEVDWNRDGGNYDKPFISIDGSTRIIYPWANWIWADSGDGKWNFVCNGYSTPRGAEILQSNYATEDIIIEQGGWEDVYDTTAITADITAEIQRATTAEQALSTRIDTKADASTWSASLKTQIDSDHSTLSGLSAKWTDILYSQIDADHTTLGTLNTYLSESKRTSIDDAISKSHTQNTDTMLANGVVSVESDKVAFSRPVVANEVQAGSAPNAHLLTKKLDASMLRTYNSFDAMVADTQRPAGCWCAIIE